MPLQSLTDKQRLNRAASNNIGPDDPRYLELIRRGFNKRFDAKPDYVRLVGSTADVIDAVQAAVRAGLRLAVRSGGHCLEGFVADPVVRVIIDTSPMSSVGFDPEMDAFVIEAGTTLGEVYRRLFLGWGVVLPAGQSPDVGIGGHALGGAFGFLHRQHGLAVDYLYAVEVVVVGEDGTARSVIATREAADPNRELWWAHTGCGGGNLGVVTRYWFRSLPKAPDSVVTLKAEWAWKDIDERAFKQLICNYEGWCEHNSGETSPYAALFSVFTAGRRQFPGPIELRALSTAGASAERQLDEYLASVTAGVGVAHTRRVEKSSWLAFALNPFPDLFAIGPGGAAASTAKLKIKDALLRRRHNDRQIAALYHHLTRDDVSVGGGIGLATYGGRVNSVPSDATAASQRAAVLDTAYTTGWQDATDEERSVGWVREFYRDVFAETGGVPVPDASCDGALINHPDADMADPVWNTSGVPWHALYYKDNYPRLQRVKARWDPRNVFHHALSIRLPDKA